MRRILARLVLALVALVIVIGLAAGTWGYRLMTRPFQGYADAETFVEIPPGSNPQSMGRALAAAGVVDGAIAFRIAVWLEGAGRRLQAGEYRFDAPMTPRAVVDKIVRGDVFLRPVTFREGLTIRQMAAIFDERGLRLGRRVHRRGVEARADPGARSAGDGSRGLSLPRHLLRCRGARPPTTSSRAWSRASRRR